MNQELEKINKWFRANQLCLNIYKTKYIIFRPSGSHQAVNDQSLYIDNQVIEQIGNHTNTISGWQLKKIFLGKAN